MKWCRLTAGAAAGYAAVAFFSQVFAAVKNIGFDYPFTKDSCTVWVFFTDKYGCDRYRCNITPHALSRRLKAGFTEAETEDYPVSFQYIKGVEAAGGSLRRTFKWKNAASFRVPLHALPRIGILPYVKKIEFVGRYSRKFGLKELNKKRQPGKIQTGGIYGPLYQFFAMLEIPWAHIYLKKLNQDAEPGKGVRIAFFDSGFRLNHRCFTHLYRRGAIKATMDFIDNDTTVADPDSVVSSPLHPLYGNDLHGSQVFSVVAAYDPPYYCGCAWGADFLLARTEDAYFDSTTGLEHELHVEEDNWAAAVVWAESLGVDIISSSLGYRRDFQDTVVIDRGGGLYDTIVDYKKSDLDGKTTIVSLAALGAVKRGVIIVNAAGNEQTDGDTSICAPGDVDGVIAVGSVNLYGSLSFFSSLGPSADGRIKPDVVAPGDRIALPDIYNPTSSLYDDISSGTSFAAPFITGVCALIKQNFPDTEARLIRERLKKYCRLLPGQTTADNRFGYGIPDALRSCMLRDDEVLLTAMDTGAIPACGAIIINSKGDTLGLTAEDGAAVIRMTEAMPADINILYKNNIRRITVDSVPGRKTVSPCSMLIKVRDSRGKPIPYVRIWFRNDNVEGTVISDSMGNAYISDFFPTPLRFTAVKAGYLPSDTLTGTLSERPVTIVVRLETSQQPLFEAYPTVFRISRHKSIFIRFAHPQAGTSSFRKAFASVRSLDGNLVWKKEIALENAPVTLQWDGTVAGMRRPTPGVYYFVFSCDKVNHRRKIIISE